jgi:hypothetical protein
MNDFMHKIYQGPLGNSVTKEEWKYLGEKPYEILTYQPCTNDINGEEQTISEANFFTNNTYDKYIGAQLDFLPLQEAMASATTVGQKQDHNGNPVGISNSNPLLDTLVYQVKFSDGSTKEDVANIIAENMYAQVDDDKGHQFNMMDELVNHQKDNKTTSTKDSYITIKGRQHPSY